MNPDQRSALEEERRFLLRSLRDLDAERAAGDVDDHDYATLRDGYTKRAADVLRGIDADRAATSTVRPRPWGRRLLTVAVVIVVAVLAGWWVARSAGERVDGQQITGVDPRSDAAVALAEARMLMGTDPLAALQRLDAVLVDDPANPEALTYRAWLLYTTVGQSSLIDVADQATADAKDGLAQAVAADAAYADAHCFLAIIAANVDDDVARARTEADTCLELGPPAAARALVEQFRAGLDESPATAGD